MERPYLDKWKQYLLREGKMPHVGPEKPPYFKNIWGSLKNVGPDTAVDVTKTMSRILKQPVTLQFNYKGTPDYEVYCLDSDGAIVYDETANDWRQIKIDLTQGSAGNWYEWGTKGGESVIMNHDKTWNYKRETKAGKRKYFVNKKDNTKLKMNRQLMAAQEAGEAWVELRPGTKAYNAVKRDIFKDK